MSDYYDDPLDNPDLDEILDDVEEEEYKEIDQELEPEPDTVQMVAPRIITGQEDRIHWQRDLCGTVNTSVEGVLGKKMRKVSLMSRTPEEQFCDNVKSLCREADISDTIRDAVLGLRSKIPDIKYKSPAGVVFGFLAIKDVGLTEKTVNKKGFENVMNRIKAVPNVVKINELDVIRYARFLKDIVRV
jgi:hypothetical protein